MFSGVLGTLALDQAAGAGGKKRARSAEPADVRERGKRQAKSLFSIIRLQFNESTADKGLTQHEIVIQVPDLQAAHHTMPLAMSIYQATCAFEKPNEPLACAIKEMQISFESALRTSLLKATQQVPLHTRMQFLMELMLRAVELGHGKLHVDEA